MASVKPNEFPIILVLDGTEELYTQTGGTNGKFLTSQVAALSVKNYSTTPILTGRKWIDGKDEWEVVIPIDHHISGTPYKHNLGIETHISIEGYAWNSSSPTNIYALNRNDAVGALAKLRFLNLDANNINNIQTDGGLDMLLFVIKFTKLA